MNIRNKYGATFLILLSVVFYTRYYIAMPMCNNRSFITLESYENLSLECNKHILVTFDVDDTIIMPQNTTSLRYGFYGLPWWFQLYGVVRHPSILWNYEYVTSLLFAYSSQVLVESAIIDVIKAYKKKCTVLGLTSMESGAWGIIKDMPEWRYRMLYSMGIQFSSVLNKKFTQFARSRGEYPLLYNGILCTNQESKGAVLGAYIDLLHKKPQQIISFDDDPNALCSIELACKERGIPCTMYHYVGSREKQLFDFTCALSELDMLMHQVS